MKNLILLLVALAFSFTMVGCKTTEDETADDTATTTTTGTASTTSGLYTSAQKVGPSIAPAASANVAGPTYAAPLYAATWSSGNLLYEVYGLIREYEYPRDEGVIDGSNMWKSLHTADSKLDNSLSGCTAITEKKLTSPFDFGADFLGEAYDCKYENESTSGSNSYVNSIGSKVSGEVITALAGWTVAETGPKMTRNVMDIKTDKSTNDLTVNSAYLVSYPDDSWYSVRIYTSGNTLTNLFSLKLMKTGNGGSSISIAGHGYSAGATNYYLFKVTTTGYGANATGAYYCIKSTATETDLKAMEDAGSATVPANCADYEAKLPTAYNIDGSESPTAASSFTGAGTNGVGLDF